MDAVTLALLKSMAGKGGGGGSADDVVLNATVAYDDSGANYNVTITSVLPSAEDLEAYFNEKRSIVLHFTDVPWDARLQPELKEVDSSMGTYYSFIGEGLGFDYDKLKYVIRFNVDNVETVSYVGKVYIGDKFIVTLTPTSLDYSGTMDKTVAQINEAYEAGMEIWFNISASGMSVTFPLADVNKDVNGQYPSFDAVIWNSIAGVVIHFATEFTDDGTKDTYGTDIYSLTPAS